MYKLSNPYFFSYFLRKVRSTLRKLRFYAKYAKYVVSYFFSYFLRKVYFYFLLEFLLEKLLLLHKSDPNTEYFKAYVEFNTVTVKRFEP